MKETTFFLDFDGVLSNSIKEAYLLTRYSLFNVSPFEKIDEHDFQNFKIFRLKITNSWQYYFFNRNKDFTQNNETKIFDEKFQKMRQKLIKNHNIFWQSLEEPTEFLMNLKPFIKKYPNNFKIISTKNKNAIINKLNYWKIPFDKANIYGKTDLINSTKGDFIHKLSIKNSYLIDDSPENIKSCEKYDNITGILTNWGYNPMPHLGKTEIEILEIIKENI